MLSNEKIIKVVTKKHKKRIISANIDNRYKYYVNHCIKYSSGIFSYSFCKICLSQNAILTRWFIKKYILSKLQNTILEKYILEDILKYAGSTCIIWNNS